MGVLRNLLAAGAIAAALFGGIAAAQVIVPLSAGSSPTINGTPQVGNVLCTQSYAGATYQWERNGSNIGGATSSCYTLVSADGGTTATVAITLNGKTVVASLSISGAPVTTAVVNTPYAGFSVAGAGGYTPYAYGLSPSSGALPTGISLDASTGAVAGTPTVLGTFSNLIPRVTDAHSATADLTPFTLTVNNVTYSTSLGAIFLPDTQIGTADLPNTQTALGGVSASKTVLTSWWVFGSHTASGTKGGLLNTTPLNQRSDGGCEAGSVGNGGTTNRAPGLCQTASDNSGAGNTAQLNFNDSTGTVSSTNGIDFPQASAFTDGGWHHFLAAVDTLNGVGAMYVDGVKQSASPTITANLQVALNTSYGFGIGNRNFGASGTMWMADVYVTTESGFVCTGVGAPVADCTGANTIPPSLLQKFIYSGRPVALGSSCTSPSPTARQPEICLSGDGTAMSTNKGFATGISARQSTNGGTAITSYGPQTAPYGPDPATIVAHRVYKKWLNSNNSATPSGTTFTTALGGYTAPASGDLIVLFGSISSLGSTNHAVTCPSGFTSFGSAFDSHEAINAIGCYKVAGGSETGAYTFGFSTTSDIQFVTWTMMDLGNVGSVDIANSNVNANGASIVSVSGATASANEEIYTLFAQGDNQYRFMVPPGSVDIYQRFFAIAGNQHLVTRTRATSAGTQVQQSATWAALPAGTDSSIGFTLAVVPN